MPQGNGTPQHPERARLPNRRPSSSSLEIDGQKFTATVGLDPATLTAREVFLSAGKEGSLLNAILNDAAVVVSIALQHGVPRAALAGAVARLPDGQHPLDPGQRRGTRPASPIGAALDLLTEKPSNGTNRP